MKSILNFFSSYFEILIAINVFFLIGGVVIYIASHLRQLSFQKFLNQSLYYFLLFCQSVLLTLTATILFYNLAQIRPLDFSAHILSSTRWVKDKTEIFFIADKELISIRANGDNRKVVFKARDKIKQYHFSPDGRYVLIVTENDLFLHDFRQQTDVLIASLDLKEPENESIKGNIHGISWGPLSQKFCYRISKWSRVSSVDHYYVYEVATQKMSLIHSPSAVLAYLIWDKQGTCLYYPKVKSVNPDSDQAQDQDRYETILYEISLKNLRPEKILQVTSYKPDIPVEELALKGINLHIPTRVYSFGHIGHQRLIARSASGKEIGINDQDILYYIPGIWWRKRLYKIPRVPDPETPIQYQYQGGRLVIEDLRFLPSGRYAIMEHFLYGILILDPVTARVGILDNQRGNTFGWYRR